MAKRRTTTKPEPPEQDNAFLTTALSRWRTVDTAEGGGAGSMRFEGTLDLKFLNLQQWDENQERDRLAEDKPALVIDQIGEPYRQLTGALRRARPSIQFNPVDNTADVDTAEIAQGLYRHVENTGGAKAARDEAAKGMCGPGWGYYRLITEFEYDQAALPPNQDGTFPPELFDQCIKYQAIENQFTVFRDPSCPLHEPWKARFCLIIEAVPEDTFTEKWPEAKMPGPADFAALGITAPEWYPEGFAWVADYFYVEETPGETVAMLQDGRVVPLAQAPDGVPILQQRTPIIRKVYLAKITGAEILEGNYDKTAGREFPADFIPVIPMYGESITVDGKRTLRGIVRAARDAQRMYNFTASEIVYELALAPKSKALVPFGGTEDLEEMWKQSPVKAFPALFYNAFDSQGRPLPPPVVAQFTDPTKIQALTVNLSQHKADLRSTTGWYDATDPSRKNTDQSGKAILARKEAQAEGSVNYTENYGLALQYEAMVGWSMIRRVYARTGRVLRIVGLEDDQQTEEVVYGQPRKSGKGKRAVQRAFEWGAARFDFVVSIGASYATRRQEGAQTTMELVEVAAKVHPPMAAALMPNAIKQMDIPGSQELSDIAKRTLPPELRGEEDEGEDDPEAMKAQLQQAEQKMQEMGQVIQGLQDAVKTDQVKAEADLQKAQLSAQSDQQTAQQSDQVKLAIEQAKIEATAQVEAQKIQADLMKVQMQIDADFRLAQMKIDADLEKARITAAAAAQARREGFVHDDISGERGHQHAMQEQASKPNGSGAGA